MNRWERKELAMSRMSSSEMDGFWITMVQYLFIMLLQTRMHVATTTLDKLVDFVCNSPEDPGNTQLCAAQRDDLFFKKLKILAKQYPNITY